MLNEHRDVVAINEFLSNLDASRRFREGRVPAGDVADLMEFVQPVANEVLGRGYRAPEVRYPFGATNARYRAGDPVPVLLLSSIAWLSEDPDVLFDEFLAFARSLPTQPMTDHYRSLFRWLARAVGKSHWVERSGSSVDFFEDLVDRFPDAKFVHIHRDGREAALSLREFPFMRLGIAVSFDLFPEGDADAAVRYALDTPTPLWAVGKYWSDQLVRGMRAVPRLNGGQYLEVPFEDLIADPREVITRVAAHFDLAGDDAFVDRAVAMVRPSSPPRFAALTAGEQAELDDAIRPGQVLLGRSR